MWTILKSLLICYSIASLFLFSFCGHEACVILAPQQGMDLIPLGLEGKVLTIGLQGKSQEVFFLSFFKRYSKLQTD